MNAALDLRYVTEGGFAAFEELAPAAAEAELAGFAAEQRGRVAAFRPGGPYASRLAERPVILMVGDTLFCHGGVLPHHLDYGVDRINGETSAWLRGETGEPEWLADREDPVWTRRYSDAPDTDACATLDEVLERVGAERLVVGHTVQEGGVAAFCDGRVWCIDVGMAAAYGGEPQALEIRGDAVRVLGAAPVVAE